LLLHYEPPLPPNGPATLVQDAILLDRNRSFESGASLIAYYSGRAVALSEPRMLTGRRPPSLQLNRRHKDKLSPAARDSGSPARSPARLLSPPKGLENLFHGVSDTLQKRTEGWKVPRVVRGAVGEVRRNMNNLPTGTASPRNSLDVEQLPPLHRSEVLLAQGAENLKRRLSALEKRNAALARMIGNALQELRMQKQSFDPKQGSVTEESFNIALAKIQFVQVYLADSDIPIPGDDGIAAGKPLEGQVGMPGTNGSGVPILLEGSGALVTAMHHADAVPSTSSTSSEAVDSISGIRVKTDDADAGALHHEKEIEDKRLKRSIGLPLQPRPALAQSPLSWILGEGQHRSDFVSSSTPPPEQRRDSVPKVRPKHLFPDGKDDEGRNGSEGEGDGFTMSRLRGNGSKT
jgi:TBC1 domain family member 5